MKMFDDTRNCRLYLSKLIIAGAEDRVHQKIVLITVITTSIVSKFHELRC